MQIFQKSSPISSSKGNARLSLSPTSSNKHKYYGTTDLYSHNSYQAYTKENENDYDGAPQTSPGKRIGAFFGKFRIPSPDKPDTHEKLLY
eukprot:g43008.t1